MKKLLIASLIFIATLQIVAAQTTSGKANRNTKTEQELLNHLYYFKIFRKVFWK